MKNRCKRTMSDPVQQAFTAVVLAGDRASSDPLVEQSTACCKAMIEIDGTPMVMRVLAALDEAELIDGCILSGPRQDQLGADPRIKGLLAAEKIDWREPLPTPSTSAYNAMHTLPTATPVLVTTADHPLLSAGIVDHFCEQSLGHGYDVTVGLTPYALVKQAFPDMKKTVLHFRDGDYCGSNLFTFLSPEGRQMADYWRHVESQRKNPLRIVRILGWGAVIKYLLGTLTLDAALATLSQRLNLRLGAVILPYAEAAVDIDSVADHTMVQEKLSGVE
jgi:GTP:adenosylcobinamide-phosphate guanylyltransferase